MCIGYLNLVDMTKNDYEVLEFFAGERRLAKLAQGLGKATASMDKMYDVDGDNIHLSNSMDLNTSGGFVLLSFQLQICYVGNSYKR